MRNIFLFVLLSLSTSYLYAQYQFKYELDFKINSKDKNFVQTEVFNLDVLDGKSVFYPESLAKLDSIVSSGNADADLDIPESLVFYIITKDLSKNEVVFQDIIGFYNYSIIENRSMEWKILPDTKVFNTITNNHYTLQKATTNFGGRQWIVWFSTEIAIQEGPYKFYGLPGLIFEAYDSDEDYKFVLFSMSKIDRLFPSDILKRIGLDVYQVDLKEYSQIKEAFHKNPGRSYRLFLESLKVNFSNEVIRVFSESAKENLSKQDNTIELTTKE